MFSRVKLGWLMLPYILEIRLSCITEQYVPDDLHQNTNKPKD